MPGQSALPSHPSEYSQPRTPIRSSLSSQSSLPIPTSNTCKPSAPSLSTQSIMARENSHASQSSHSSQYNTARIRVSGGLTPNLTSNKSTQYSQDDHSSQSSLPSRTFHTIQSRPTSKYSLRRKSILS